MKKYLLLSAVLAYATLSQAIELNADKDLGKTVTQIRESIKTDGYPTDGITVWLEPSNYSFEKPIVFDASVSGTKEKPIEFKVKGNGKAVFNGGQNLDTSTAKIVSETTMLKRLSENARGMVYSLQITDAELVKLLSNSNAKLSLNGSMMKLSSYPNIGYGHVDRILDEGAIYAHGRTLGTPPKSTMEEPIGGEFTVFDKDISAWEAEFIDVQKAKVTGYLSYDWYKESHPIASITNGKVKLKDYSRYGVLNKEKIPRRIVVTNLLCELDSPGEFYFDESSNRLLFWPFDANIENAQLSLWAGNSFAICNKASNIRFENIVVEAVSQGSSVFDITNSENIELAGCVIKNCSRPAVIINGGKNCGIVSCDIFDVPHHVTLNGGDIKNLVPSGHYAKNCHFTQVQATDFYGKIQIVGVGQIFKNNLIHNFIGQVMTVGSNDNIIEYNEFFNIGIEEGDGGTIYSGAAMWSWGNVYRHNFLHHLMCIPEAHPRGGIYPDDRDQGDTITENVFYKAAHRAVLLNGGAGHSVTSNLFLACHIGVYNTDNDWEKMYNMQSEYESGKLKRGDKMDYIWRCENVIGKEGWNSEIWKTKYPLFAKIMNQEKQRFRPIECTVSDNCFSETAHNTQFLTKDSQGKRLEVPMEKSGIIRASSNRNIPMNVFNNLDTLDFSYHNKKLIGRLPDVKFEKIGLYQDQYRKTVPDKNVYRKAIKEKFNSRKSFDPDAKYNAKTINDSLYFNTGALIMGMCK